MERALKNRPVDPEGAKWAEGIELIYRKLVTILENENVKRIPANCAFDQIHVSISLQTPDQKSGQVMQSCQGLYDGNGLLVGARFECKLRRNLGKSRYSFGPPNSLRGKVGGDGSNPG
jgi:hypothetical protein